MPNCVPPIVNSWSKKGDLPNTKPDRVDRPSTNFGGVGAGGLPAPAPRGVGPDALAAQVAQGGVPGRFEAQPLEVTGAAQDAAALRDPDRRHGAAGGER